MFRSASTAVRRVKNEPLQAPMVPRRVLRRAAVYALMTLIALVFILPLVWDISTSFKHKSQWFTKDIHWIPQRLTLANYEKIFSDAATPIGRWLLNSVWLTSPSNSRSMKAGAGKAAGLPMLFPSVRAKSPFLICPGAAKLNGPSRSSREMRNSMAPIRSDI